jgi:tRNA A37 threonylcarbamoyltransferase TsaD
MSFDLLSFFLSFSLSFFLSHTQALSEAGIQPCDLTALAYTRGPGMGAPLMTVAIVVRMLSQIWNKPIIAVNHCVGRMHCSLSFILF